MGVPPRKKFWNEITNALRKQQRVFLSGTENAVNKQSSFIEAKPFLRGGGTMREWIRLLVSCHLKRTTKMSSSEIRYGSASSTDDGTLAKAGMF